MSYRRFYEKKKFFSVFVLKPDLKAYSSMYLFIYLSYLHIYSKLNKLNQFKEINEKAKKDV